MKSFLDDKNKPELKADLFPSIAFDVLLTKV